MPVGDITISTMMQYNGDSKFYTIDTITTDPNFRATKGTIDSESMSVTSIYGDFSTYADNQAYDLKFTSSHKVFAGGYIKIIFPGEFTMSSESGAIASFSVTDNSGNSYASVFQVSSESNYITG